LIQCGRPSQTEPPSALDINVIAAGMAPQAALQPEVRCIN
jgi:hypothetical protein